VAVVPRADPALRRQLADAIDGKSEVRVGPQAGVVEGLTAVRVDQTVHIHLRRDVPERHVAAPHGGVERRLTRSDESRTRHQRQATLGQRLLQRRPWDRIDPAPRIGFEK